MYFFHVGSVSQPILYCFNKFLGLEFLSLILYKRLKHIMNFT
jgi:hypothetical protein